MQLHNNRNMYYEKYRTRAPYQTRGLVFSLKFDWHARVYRLHRDMGLRHLIAENTSTAWTCVSGVGFKVVGGSTATDGGQTNLPPKSSFEGVSSPWLLIVFLVTASL